MQKIRKHYSKTLFENIIKRETPLGEISEKRASTTLRYDFLNFFVAQKYNENYKHQIMILEEVLRML